MGLFEPHHLIVILVIALVIFGPGKIGDLGGSLGRGIRDFKRAMHEEDEIRVSPPADTPAATADAAPAQPEAIAQAATPTVATGTAVKEAV